MSTRRLTWLLPALELLIAGALVCLFFRIRSSFAVQERAFKQQAAYNEQLADAPLRSLVGITPAGRQIFQQKPVAGTKMVVFALHGANFTRDLEFWTQVNAQLRGRAVLVGICDSEACSDIARNPTATAAIRILEFAGLAAMSAVASADQGAECLVVNQDTVPIARLHWDSRGAGASALARQIVAIP
ncbi:MAG: hypothetical protein ACRD1E_01600 [Terriglobales bacterium]